MSEVVIEVGNRTARDVHQDIQAAAKSGASISVQAPLARHNLGVGLPNNCHVQFQGSVGYYCGGLNNGARVDIHGDAGWGCGEAMALGHITVNGYAGMSVGAAMLGGTIHVRGDCGPRAGVAMKNGTIVVEGKLGYQAGFMAHGGKILALGGADASCADALWEGEVWVCGDIKDVGVDALVTEPTAEQVEEVEGMLEPLGLADAKREWRRIVAGKRLWYFESGDAKAWLMI